MRSRRFCSTAPALGGIGALSRRDFIKTAAGTAIAASAGGLGLLRPDRSDAATTQRPLSDFLNAQGTTSIPIAFGPIPAFLGWTPQAGDPLGRIDYAGLATSFLASLGISLGTSIAGSVSERPLADGRAEVTVLLHTMNALAWAQQVTNGAPGAPLLGFLPDEIAADPIHNAPAVGESFTQFVFDNTAPGAPLPDLAVVFASPGFQLLILSFRGTARGPLRPAFGVPQGTRGELVISRTGLLGTAPKTNPNSRVALDSYPAELVDLHVIG
jgi:hypothetical protein